MSPLLGDANVGTCRRRDTSDIMQHLLNFDRIAKAAYIILPVVSPAFQRRQSERLVRPLIGGVAHGTEFSPCVTFRHREDIDA